MSKVYIANLRKYSSTFTVLKTVKVDGDGGKKVEVQRPDVEVTFEKRNVDTMTGAVITSGYTALDKSVYDALIAQSPVFAGFIKSGEYIYHDELPEDALSGGEIIEKVSGELAVAKARIIELETMLATGSKDDLVIDLQKQLETAKDSVEALTATNTELKTELDAANAKIADLEKTESGAL